MTDSLPTYQNEARMLSDDNIYREMYGESIDGGICGCGKGVESMQHIMCECEENKEERDKVWQKIRKVWEGKGEEWLGVD